MSKYTFTLSDGVVATLRENDSPVFLLTEESVAIHYQENPDIVAQFTPTMKFWKNLVLVNDETSRIAEYIKSHRNYGIDESAMPDPDAFGVQYSTEIPEYEAKTAYQIGRRLLDYRMEMTKVFTEKPTLRRLFRHAYTEATGEVPEYLRDFVNQS